MTTPHPDSPLALSQASLWRHTKMLIADMKEATINHSKEVCTHGYCLFVYLLVYLTWPISLPLIAYLRRRRYRKEVAKWDRTTKESK